ncbi:MRG-domain-containing protein [Basidiobolus meristosporus CBS 931.73]|uniref:Chromatin modification-related protein EAF3 n=1 Tax=Basidiobolus meristosporus CBS 931.73 TaxID=1314790 RepID=A0A1Y1YJU6_9FUNG|nr:MRG-domain-containing protein [Basidiobolus meristosporus CBS 931.73]|eukprot:ORX98279.1 MRG-domain-containing protein [Basidiobolus meristosporus CBS 931.73]
MTEQERKLSFKKEEKILCFHGPLLYEAKVLKAEWWDAGVDPETGEELEEGPHYFVHYKGWKRTWDEWVPESRTLKHNAENLAKQSELKQVYKTKKGGRNKETTSTTRKRSRETSSEKAKQTDEAYWKPPDIRILIPGPLKERLVTDWEWIVKQQRLVPLPRSPSVTAILDEYRIFSSTRNGNRESVDIMNEILLGIKQYFNKALGTILLYRFEREQFSDFTVESPQQEAADIYGAEHLLRLFVQMPMLLSHANMEQDGISIMRDHFSHFLNYLQENKHYFLDEYDNASPEYISRVKKSS